MLAKVNDSSNKLFAEVWVRRWMISFYIQMKKKTKKKKQYQEEIYSLWTFRYL